MNWGSSAVLTAKRSFTAWPTHALGAKTLGLGDYLIKTAVQSLLRVFERMTEHLVYDLDWNWTTA
ncbi:MAG: hypothetical protein V3V48_05780 [Candidatus Aminicenantaceae bacterium]